MKLTTKLLQDSKDATSKSATAAVSDKKSDDDSAVKDKSSSAGWGAKKSFADILKEKRAAAAKMSQGSSDESSPKVSEFEDSAPTPFRFFFSSGEGFQTFELLSFAHETCGLDTTFCVKRATNFELRGKVQTS